MNPINALVEYLRSVNSELRKVSWPSRRDTIRYSALVIGISIVTAGSFAMLDYGLTTLSEAAITARARAVSQSAEQNTSSTAPVTAPAAKPTIDFNDVTPITTPASSTTNPQK